MRKDQDTKIKARTNPAIVPKFPWNTWNKRLASTRTTPSHLMHIILLILPKLHLPQYAQQLQQPPFSSDTPIITNAQKPPACRIPHLTLDAYPQHAQQLQKPPFSSDSPIIPNAQKPPDRRLPHWASSDSVAFAKSYHRNVECWALDIIVSPLSPIIRILSPAPLNS